MRCDTKAPAGVLVMCACLFTKERQWRQVLHVVISVLHLGLAPTTGVSAFDDGDVEEHEGHENDHASVAHCRTRDTQRNMLKNDTGEEDSVQGRTNAED